MGTFEIKITKQALKDIKTLTPKLKKKLKDIFEEVMANDPLKGKKLAGELTGNYSYKLNIKDRIAYSIDQENKIVYIKRVRTHYGE